MEPRRRRINEQIGGELVLLKTENYCSLRPPAVTRRGRSPVPSTVFLARSSRKMSKRERKNNIIDFRAHVRARRALALVTFLQYQF
ncbi:hypothetical protein EVAR_63167_1 [Eumeta japonica]|uniref:Uncharacterized protein n=1 Tax=Eumeta variegata TaxID=151549 RepID=A0A4C1Z2C4_EUMVA|nr:hypothetical protein EVAR_63167_1 [Eumeta japonica]